MESPLFEFLGNPPPPVGNLPFHKAFIVPPFSVLDGRTGGWNTRKNWWAKRIQDNAESRQDLLFKSDGADTVSKQIRSVGSATSIFDPVLAEVLFHWFCPPGGFVVDPCAGGASGFVACATGFRFLGVELRREQVVLNQGRLDRYRLDTGKYVCDDGRNILDHVPPGSADLLFSCPPYHNLERYSALPNDLSTMSYAAFMDALGEIIHAGLRTLKPNRFAVYVVGDVRAPSGGYRQFPQDVTRAFSVTGARLWSHAIVLNNVGSAALRAAAPMQRNRNLTKIHQDVLVFYRGDPKEIRNEFPELSMPSAPVIV